MSSGLDWLEHYKKPISVTAKSYYGTNLKKLMLEREFVSPPGLVHEYKSGDTQLLGIVLERAVGKIFLLLVRFFVKIGAKNNAFWSLDYNGGLKRFLLF